MSSHHQRLPEPTLPEHELIRAADALPELSSGLRSSTLVVCQAHLRRAQRIQRLKVAAMVAVAASAVFAVWTMSTGDPADGPQPIVHESPQAPASQNHRSPSSSSPGTKSGTGISLGNPGRTNTSDELDLIDNTIEEMQRRTQKLMDAGLFPSF